MIEDSVETLRLANVALGGVWDAFLGQAVEAGNEVSNGSPDGLHRHTDLLGLAWGRDHSSAT